MAEQQFTQEDLTALNQDSQSLDQMPMQGPVPKPKEAVKTAKIDEKKPLIPVGQQAVSIGEFKTPAQKSIEEEAVKEPTNLGSLAYSFDSVKGLDATYSDFPLQGRMKIEGYRAAYENKNNQIKRHQKLIDNIVAKTTDEFDIEDLTQTDQNGNKGLDKERLRRIVTNKVKAIGGNGIVADYVYSKAAIAAEYKFNLNKQKTAFDEKLKTANIPKPKDADIVEKEFKDVELKARMEMKSARESLNMDFISEANRVNDKYAYSLNEVVANAPYKMNDAVNEAKTQLLNEKIDSTGQYQYFESSVPEISDEEIKQRAASLFEQNNADYLTTEYLPVVAQMQNEIKGVSKKYNNILERKKSELQATYEKKFSQMKAMYEKEANDYNSKIDKLWNETGVELKSEQEKKMMDTYKNMGMTDAFLSKFSGAAGNMLFGLGTHLRANGIEGSIIDFLTASGQDARFYNNTYTPSIKDAYLSPKFWAGGVGELLGSSSVIAATTIATQNPYIGGLLSNIVEGSSIAGAAYDNQLMKGKDPLEAREAANNVVKMNMLTMPLNALQAKLFMPFTKGAGFTGAFKKLAAGSAGGTVEEMFQSTFEEGEGFKAEKFYAPDTLEMGLQVFGTQMLMGVPGGAVSGLVDNINKNKNIPSPMAQIGARMARENGPSRVSAIAEGLNAIGEIDEQQTAQMKMLSDAIVEIEKEATSIGLEGDKKDAYVGIAYDIKQLEQQKSQAGSESAKSVLDDQLSEKKQQLRRIINDQGEVVRVVVAGTSIVAPIEEVNKLADTAEFQEAVKNDDVSIQTNNQELLAKVKSIKTPQVPSEVAPAVAEVAPTPVDIMGQMTEDEKASFANDVVDAVAGFRSIRNADEGARKMMDNIRAEVRQNPMVALDKAIDNAQKSLEKAKAESTGDVFSQANIEASQNVLDNLNQIKEKYATQISERQQQEIPQPSNIVQREGTQEGQPQVGQAEGGIGQATQPAADTRNRPISSQAQEEVTAPVSTDAKADIERRRQEELLPINGNSVEDLLNQGAPEEIFSEWKKASKERSNYKREDVEDKKKHEEWIQRVDELWRDALAKGRDYINNKINAKYDAELAALKQTPAPSMGTAPVEDIMTLDTKDETNLQKVFNFLDNIDKQLDKFGRETAGINLALPVVRAIVKAVKALVQGGMTLQDAIKKAAADNNVSEQDVFDSINIMSTIQQRGTTGKPTAGIGKIFSAIKDIANITKKDKAVLKEQVRSYVAGAKDAMSAYRAASEALVKDIKDMVKAGAISTKQAANIIAKFGKINILSPKSVGKFVDYMTKVFNDAEYENKLSNGKKLRKDISKLSKNKDKNANLRDLGSKFLDIDPSMVDDIDEYNRIAEQVKESLAGSKIKKDEIIFASIANIDDVTAYINNSLDNQNKKIKEETAAEIQELMGIDVSDFSYDDMLALLDKDATVTKENESIIRATAKKAFDIYSSIIKKAIDRKADPFTEAPFELTETQKDLITRFMAMDLNMLPVKEAINAVDALNNFITNKSTAKMDAVVSEYTGRMGAKEVKSKGIKSVPLKKYFSGPIGRILAEQTTNLGPLFERMFKGVKRGGFVEDKSGLTKVKNGKALAETKANNIAKEYVALYYNKKANGDVFNSLKNMVERGMIAFLSRNVIGTQAERDAEFNRRKNLVKESIDVLLNGNTKEREKGAAYKEIYDKLDVGNAKSPQDAISKADAINTEAVAWWTNKWAEIFPELSDLSQNVYNIILEKDTEYNPDRIKRASTASKIDDITNKESTFHHNNGTIYKKETGVLMSATRPETLPLGKRGKPDVYVDLSFDNNNASSMYDALIDIHTASAIRQLDGFLKSSEFDDIVNQDDKELFENRIDLYIRRVRNKAPFVDDELEKGLKKLNNLAAVGVGQALGGLTQPIKQVIPVIANTIINAGGFDLGAVKDKNKRNFINRSGYSIANRGVESQAQIDSINKIIEVAASGNTRKFLRTIEKINNFWLKNLLVKPDAWVARTSWLTYYQKSLKEQGIDPETIDWATHEVNEEAGNYAQRMVDRQQNISDPAQAGALFADSDNSFKNFIVKTTMPFASFRINQATRLANDVSTLSKWSTSTKEDKEIALRSLGGFSVEMATFGLISGIISYIIGNVTNYIMGEEEEEEEKEKRKENIIRGQATRAVADILSPSPFPLIDKSVQFGVYTLADDVQEIVGIVEDDKVNIFEPRPTEFFEGLGLLGITGQRMAQLVEMGDLSILNGSFEDRYGNKKFLTEKDKENVKMLITPALLSSVGILPSEANSIARKGLNNAKKRALTEKQMKAGGKRVKKAKMPGMRSESMRGSSNRGKIRP